MEYFPVDFLQQMIFEITNEFAVDALSTGTGMHSLCMKQGPRSRVLLVML
jgi:hypothetical protein